MDERILIWSPNYRGNRAQWDWIAAVSNGGWSEPPSLTDEQIRDAYACGYITTALRDKLNGFV